MSGLAGKPLLEAQRGTSAGPGNTKMHPRGTRYEECTQPPHGTTRESLREFLDRERSRQAGAFTNGQWHDLLDKR